MRAGEPLGCADQYMVKADGEPVNNRCLMMAAAAEGDDPSRKVEDDHRLVWFAPDEALRILRLDSQAWAVATWIRREARLAKGEAA